MGIFRRLEGFKLTGGQVTTYSSIRLSWCEVDVHRIAPV